MNVNLNMDTGINKHGQANLNMDVDINKYGLASRHWMHVGVDMYMYICMYVVK